MSNENKPVSFDTVANSLSDVETGTELPEYGKPVNTEDHPKPKPTPSMIERMMFPDITGLPYSERKIGKMAGVTIKVAGADRPEKWWSDVLMGRRYLEIISGTPDPDITREEGMPPISEEGPKPAV